MEKSGVGTSGDETWVKLLSGVVRSGDYVRGHIDGRENFDKLIDHYSVASHSSFAERQSSSAFSASSEDLLRCISKGTLSGNKSLGGCLLFIMECLLSPAGGPKSDSACTVPLEKDTKQIKQSRAARANPATDCNQVGREVPSNDDVASSHAISRIFNQCRPPFVSQDSEEEKR